jgi:hypothetical protein
MTKGFFGIQSSKQLFMNIINTFEKYKDNSTDYNLFLLTIALDSCIEWLEKENEGKKEIIKEILSLRENFIKKAANRAKHKMKKVGSLDKGGFVIDESIIDGEDLIGNNHRLDKEYFLTEIEKLMKLISEFYNLTPEEIKIVEGENI